MTNIPPPLPARLIDQIRQAGLPQGGAVPFRSKLGKHKERQGLGRKGLRLATGVQLRLVSDEETKGRHFLTMAGRGYGLRVTLTQEQMDDVAAALAKVISQLGL